MSSSSVRLWFLMSTLVVVVIALLAPPAVSRTDKEMKGDDDANAQVIKVADSCARKCHDLCAVLPKGEDPLCDRRCDSISTAFNGTTKSPTVLDPQTILVAVEEIHMCTAGCFLRCIPDDEATSCSCKDKCEDTYRQFGPIITMLGKTMAANGLTAPKAPHAPRKDNFKLETCSDPCNHKCVAQGKTKQKQECAGSCAEACSLYGAATTVLQAAMPPPAVPSPAALGDDTIENTFKACNQHCAANDKKCAAKCGYACYIIARAKATMKLATGGFGLPA